MTEPTSPGTQFPVPPQAPPQPASVNVRPPAALDLDALEREGAPAPFDFVLDGERYLMSDPKEVDWQDLIAAMSSPHMFFRLVLPADQHEKFFNTRLPSWKMNALMQRYQDHYGLPNIPNAGGLLR